MNIATRRAQRALVRYTRLIELRDSACNKSAAEFARALKIADTYAVRMFWPPGTKGRKGVGPDMESAIIDAFNLPANWFDLPPGTALPSQISNRVNETIESYGDTKTRSDEDLLMRAFRAAEPAVRAAWLDQARGIMERIHTPPLLSGNAIPRAG